MNECVVCAKRKKGRSDKKTCSNACRQRLYRQKKAQAGKDKTVTNRA